MADKNVVNEVNANRKSTTLQAVKAIAVLVIICLVCVILLSLCNDLFYISDEERARRAEAKINKSLVEVYPAFVEDTGFNKTLNKEFAVNASYGSVTKVVRSTDGTYIIAAEGLGGYGKIPVTVLVAIDKTAKIAAWKISDGGAETQLDNLKGVDKIWYIGEPVSTDLSHAPVAGTTMSSNAVTNAIRMASYYAINALHLGSNPEGEAKEAVLALLGESYAEYALNSYSILSIEIGSDTVASMLSDEDNQINYVLYGTGANGDITAFVYGTDENRKIMVLTKDGFVNSENVTGSEAFAQKVVNSRIYSTTLSGSMNYSLIYGIEENGSNVVYTVAGLRYNTQPSTYVLKVTVNANGEVAGIELVRNGYLAGPPTEADSNVLATSGLLGATLDTVDSLYSSNKVSGATESANLITVAVKAVLQDYNTYFAASQD